MSTRSCSTSTSTTRSPSVIALTPPETSIQSYSSSQSLSMIGSSSFPAAPSTTIASMSSSPPSSSSSSSRTLPTCRDHYRNDHPLLLLSGGQVAWRWRESLFRSQSLHCPSKLVSNCEHNWQPYGSACLSLHLPGFCVLKRLEAWWCHGNCHHTASTALTMASSWHPGSQSLCHCRWKQECKW